MDMPSPESDVRDGPLLKKMRKGTRSCTECRRRKVKCVYLAGQDKCKDCRFRGCSCIEQFIDNARSSAQKTKSMRERISELEELVQALLAGKVTGLAGEARVFVDDVAPPTPGLSAELTATPMCPLMRMFDNAVISQVNDQVPVDKRAHTSGRANSSSSEDASITSLGSRDALGDTRSKRLTNLKASKDEYTRNKLLECIDLGEGLDGAFHENEQRWIAWRYRILGSLPPETLTDWGKWAIRYGSPADLGVLVLFIGTRSNHPSSRSLTPLVAVLITSDDDYTTTLSGIECSLLLSDYHARIGQPRRAWLAIQTGLASAQLIGLNRYRSSPLCTGMWSLLHYNNQFLSLMLGVPRGVDFQCDTRHIEDPFMCFRAKLSNLCNKFIVQSQDRSEPSSALILELDQELQVLALLMPAEWRDIQANLSDPTELHSTYIQHERILTQMHLQQLRIYLYLPIMLGSGPVPPLPTTMHELSRSACLHSARELLKSYHFLAKETVYENALLDFIGFSAAMLIVLNLFGYYQLHDEDEDPKRDSKKCEQDWQNINTTVQILADRAKKKNNKVTRQSLEVLRTLSATRSSDYIIPPGCSYRFIVPFFGELTVQSGTKFKPMTATNRATSSEPLAATQDTERSLDERSASASQGVSVHSCASSNARNPITISAFSGWNRPYSIPQQPEVPPQHAAYEPGKSSPDRNLNDLQDFDFGLGMEPMQYSQQWQYVSGMELNQDWLWFTEPSESDQNSYNYQTF